MKTIQSAVVALLLLLSGNTFAAYTLYFFESGGNVVASGSGSMNLGALSPAGSGPLSPRGHCFGWVGLHRHGWHRGRLPGDIRPTSVRGRRPCRGECRIWRHGGPGQHNARFRLRPGRLRLGLCAHVLGHLDCDLAGQPGAHTGHLSLDLGHGPDSGFIHGPHRHRAASIHSDAV